MTATGQPRCIVALLGVAGHRLDRFVDTLRGEDECEAHGVRAVTVSAADRRFRIVHGADHAEIMQVLFQQEPVPHAAVPVVSTEIGVTVGLREQLFVASRLGVPVPAAVLTGGGVAFDFVERSLRLRLAECGYPADDVPVLPTEARGDFLDALNAVPAASPLEPMGFTHDTRFVLEGVGPGELRVGQAIAAPSPPRAATTFEAIVHLRSMVADDPPSPIKSGDRGLLHLHNAHWLVRWTLLAGQDILASGEVGSVRVELSPVQALAVYPGLAFGVREGGRTVGWGRVTRVVG